MFNYKADKDNFSEEDIDKPNYIFFRFLKRDLGDGTTNEVGDSEISKWVDEAYKHCLETDTFYSCGTGNTLVIGLPFEDEIQVIIVKNYDEYSIER